MSPSSAPLYLSVDRAFEFIGDHKGVLSLLNTLQQTLRSDLPRIQQLLDQDDMNGVNRLLHQLKGFTPVFCVDRLVELVVHVEHLSKHGATSEIRSAYNLLAPQLDKLLAEVGEHLAANPQN